MNFWSVRPNTYNCTGKLKNPKLQKTMNCALKLTSIANTEKALQMLNDKLQIKLYLSV